MPFGPSPGLTFVVAAIGLNARAMCLPTSVCRTNDVEDLVFVKGGDLSKSEASVTYMPSVRAGRRRGRPTKVAAGNLSQMIVDIAFRQFLEAGFASTSMEAIAAEARISKRTLYDRFPSKILLFEAALQRHSTSDFEDFRRFELWTEPFDQALCDMADWLVEHIPSERNIALYRLLAAEANRTTELAQYSQEKLTGLVVAVLKNVFLRAIERGEIVDIPAYFLAEQFLHAVCGPLIRERLYGVFRDVDPAVMAQRNRNVVGLFLAGAGARREKSGA